ncbi:MAG TPA: hypothetical protein VJ770_10010 [Stellaceae bacterium]|nr:hypothetical protein [Stellaceae bacterium]
MQSRHSYPRNEDRERIIQARREAEALFTSKRPIREPSASDPSPPAAPADPSPRKPRILRALSPAPVRREESEAPVRPDPRPPAEIPSTQFARIRTLVKYGMTPTQVAGIYGVAVDVIERILRKA